MHISFIVEFPNSIHVALLHLFSSIECSFSFQFLLISSDFFSNVLIFLFLKMCYCDDLEMTRKKKPFLDHFYIECSTLLNNIQYWIFSAFLSVLFLEILTENFRINFWLIKVIFVFLNNLQN